MVAIPRALNCSSAPAGPAIVTVGIEAYPYPLLPILIVSTIPDSSIVHVAVACIAPVFPENEIDGVTVYPDPQLHQSLLPMDLQR